MKSVFHKNLKLFSLKKEEAVSPVIATILMVAVTVVLAATVYLMVSHYGTGGSAPIAGSLGVMSETSSTVTTQLTYTMPANLSTLSDVHFTLLSSTGATLGTYTLKSGTNGLTVTGSSSSYTMTITNPNSKVSDALESGAIITLSGSGLSGDVLDLTYSGNSGSVSLTIP